MKIILNYQPQDNENFADTSFIKGNEYEVTFEDNAEYVIYNAGLDEKRYISKWLYNDAGSYDEYGQDKPINPDTFRIPAVTVTDDSPINKHNECRDGKSL